MTKRKAKELPDAYWEGIDAAIDGKPLESNPYKKPSRRWWIPKYRNAWLWWRRGWFGL